VRGLVERNQRFRQLIERNEPSPGREADETDGPMLLHGLQGVHNQRISTPRSNELKPDRDLLERRYERFLKAG
jgi:hypothetical protein